MKVYLIYALAAVAEIAGCFSFWAWLKLGKTGWILLPGMLALAAFAWALTLVPTETAGRAYAAYGGIYIAASLLWLWGVEGHVPDKWDIAGGAVCLAGTAIILFGPGLKEQTMCGRFVLKATPEEIANYLDLIGLEDFPARFNIAPTQPILIVLEGERQERGSNLPNRRAMLVRWGFLPGWVKDPKDFPLLINARSETAIGKASFRAAMRHRRVLVPATGFYEWRRPPKEEGGKPQPYFIRPKNGGIVAFAGLMETWSSADGSEVDTGAILTTAANSAIGRIHDRMPVVIAPEDFSRWLDCKTQEPREVSDLMRPVQDDFFEMIPVSDKVNKVANVGADLIEPVPESAPLAKIKPPKDDGQMSLF